MEPEKIKTLRQWLNWGKKYPIQALVCFVIFSLLTLISIPFITSFFGEKGKQLANPLQSSESPTQLKDTPLSSKFAKKAVDSPIKNFNSRYNLAADLTILEDYVIVDGINVRGNVYVKNSEGVELKKMKLFNSEEKAEGKINIDRSQDFIIKENVVANEINVDRSKSFDVEKNTVGEIADRDRQAQKKTNIILLEESFPADVMSSLITIQKLISEDKILANALGKRVQLLDKENNGRYKTIIINHLKKLEIDTLQKAESHDVGMVFDWLDFFLDFNGK